MTGDFRRYRTERQAFSLFELMAIITMIGVVAGVVLYRLDALEQKETAESVMRQNIGMLQSAVERYRFDRNQFPAQLQDLAREGFLPTMPGETAFYKYRYDAVTGLVDFTER